MEKTDIEKKQVVKDVLYEYLERNKIPLDKVRELAEDGAIDHSSTYTIRHRDRSDSMAFSGPVKSLRFHPEDGGFYTASSDHERLNLTSFYATTYGDWWYIVKEDN